MAAIDNNKFNIIIWMEKVFLSCNTIDHLLSMRRLVRNYENLHEQKKAEMLSKNLRTRIDLKLTKLRYDNKH